jgi:hypothetical protein
VNEETKDHQELKVLQVILAPEVILAVMECKEQKDQWDLLENLEMMDYQEDLARMAFLELRVHKVSRYSVVISQHSSYHSDLYLGLICLLDLMEGS